MRSAYKEGLTPGVKGRGRIRHPARRHTSAFLAFDASPPVACHAPAPAADSRSDCGIAWG